MKWGVIRQFYVFKSKYIVSFTAILMVIWCAYIMLHMGLMSGYLNLRSGLLACSVSVLFNIGLLMCTHPIGKKYTIITMIATLPSAIILPQLMWFYSPIMAGVLGGVYMIAIHQLFLIKDSV